jgi:hypothetical protein
MTSPVLSALNRYRASHHERDPNLARVGNPDELALISLEDGRLELAECAPSTGFLLDPSETFNRDKKYLWVVGRDDVRCALEFGVFGRSRARGSLTHTNLTGGKSAHSGGEAWFSSDTRLIFNGSSGRYPARTEKELDDLADALRRGGYECAHMGWDNENQRSARLIRGELKWK